MNPNPNEVITQEKSKTLEQDIAESTLIIIHTGRQIESLMKTRQYWKHLFQQWFEAFGSLYDMTHTVNSVKTSKWGNSLLVRQIEQYFSNSAKTHAITNVEHGLKLSRAYIDSLKSAGLITINGK